MRSTLRSLFAFMAIMGMVFGSISMASAAINGPFDVEGNVCPGYDDPLTEVLEGTDKTDMETLLEEGVEVATYEVTAPDGYLISGFCVKAGSENQVDGGPEYYSVDPAQKTLTLSHSTGKNLSHFSIAYVPVEEEMGEWCSPGYWRQPQHLDSWGDTGYLPGDYFSAVFGVTSVKQGKTTIDVSAATLLDVLQGPETYGGNAFNMVGDLLSEAHPDVDFTGERVEDSCPLN